MRAEALLALAALASALDPAGRGASEIASLWWVLVVATLFPFALVVAYLVLGLLRARGSDRPPALDRFSDQQLVLAGGVGLPILVLVPVIAMTIGVGRSLEGAAGTADDSLTVSVQGRQFWWDVTYLPSGDGRVSAPFRTANEIHVPVGRPVSLVLGSDDVIHSFWVPRLHGKIDLIPGRVNRLTIEADRPGEYVGRCAELCGMSHALMRLVVVAHEKDEFDAWLERESAPAAREAVARTDASLRQGFANFCAPCHTVRGMFEDEPEAFTGTFGPDLTHLAARRKVANVLPLTREGLGRWIVDPQSVKPGSLMPDVGLEGDQLAEIVDFLLTLE